MSPAQEQAAVHPPALVDPSGQPARRQADRACPSCRADKRIVSSGFGMPHPICAVCGYEWMHEVWHG